MYNFILNSLLRRMQRETFTNRFISHVLIECKFLELLSVRLLTLISQILRLTFIWEIKWMNNIWLRNIGFLIQVPYRFRSTSYRNLAYKSKWKTHTHAFLTFELIPTDIKQITTKIILQSTIYYSFIRKVKVHDKFLLPIQFTFTQPPVR